MLHWRGGQATGERVFNHLEEGWSEAQQEQFINPELATGFLFHKAVFLCWENVFWCEWVRPIIPPWSPLCTPPPPTVTTGLFLPIVYLTHTMGIIIVLCSTPIGVGVPQGRLCTQCSTHQCKVFVVPPSCRSTGLSKQRSGRQAAVFRIFRDRCFL